jgi:hypothetical protein
MKKTNLLNRCSGFRQVRPKTRKLMAPFSQMGIESIFQCRVYSGLGHMPPSDFVHQLIQFGEKFTDMQNTDRAGNSGHLMNWDSKKGCLQLAPPGEIVGIMLFKFPEWHERLIKQGNTALDRFFNNRNGWPIEFTISLSMCERLMQFGTCCLLFREPNRKAYAGYGTYRLGPRSPGCALHRGKPRPGTCRRNSNKHEYRNQDPRTKSVWPTPLFFHRNCLPFSKRNVQHENRTPHGIAKKAAIWSNEQMVKIRGML